MKFSKRAEHTPRALIDPGMAQELGRPNYMLANVVAVTLRKLERDKLAPPFLSSVESSVLFPMPNWRRAT